MQTKIFKSEKWNISKNVSHVLCRLYNEKCILTCFGKLPTILCRIRKDMIISLNNEYVLGDNKTEERKFITTFVWLSLHLLQLLIQKMSRYVQDFKHFSEMFCLHMENNHKTDFWMNIWMNQMNWTYKMNDQQMTFN